MVASLPLLGVALEGGVGRNDGNFSAWLSLFNTRLSSSNLSTSFCSSFSLDEEPPSLTLFLSLRSSSSSLKTSRFSFSRSSSAVLTLRLSFSRSSSALLTLLFRSVSDDSSPFTTFSRRCTVLLPSPGLSRASSVMDRFSSSSSFAISVSLLGTVDFTVDLSRSASS